MQAFITVIGKLITLFIYVIVGFVACKKKVVSQEFCNGISRFLLTITLPCLILKTFEMDYTPEKLIQAGQVFLISLIILGISIGFGYLSVPVFKITPAAASVWIYAVAFPNHSFMGWPVMAAVFGDEAIFYATFANLAFSAYAYTFGIWLMARTGQHQEETQHPSIWSRILTPINITMVVGLILFITQWRLPTAVDQAVSGFSSLTTPLAMFYVGTILTQNESVRDVFADYRVYACSLLRLVVIPVLVFIFARPFIQDNLVYGVVVIGHAMPVAGFCAIFAGEYGNDVVLSSKLIFVSTLLCLITIPVFSVLLPAV